MALPVCLGGAALALVLALDGGDNSGPVTANSMVAISSTSGRVERALPVGGDPTAVAVGAGAVWALNADDQTITRIDPKTHAVRTFGTGGIPVDLAAGDGSLWVGNGSRTSAQFVGPVATSIARLDPDSAAVLATVTLPRAKGRVSEPEPLPHQRDPSSGLGGEPGLHGLPDRSGVEPHRGPRSAT